MSFFGVDTDKMVYKKCQQSCRWDDCQLLGWCRKSHFWSRNALKPRISQQILIEPTIIINFWSSQVTDMTVALSQIEENVNCDIQSPIFLKEWVRDVMVLVSYRP